MRRVQVLALFIVFALAGILNACVYSKPETQKAAGPRVWGLPASADDKDVFCLLGIEQPKYCRTVGVLRDFMRSIQAQP